MTIEALYTLLGLAIGAAIVIAVTVSRKRYERALTMQLIEDAKKQSDASLAAVTDQLKTAFAALSRDALSGNTDDFLKLAKTKLEGQLADGEKSLEGKKKLIDAQLHEMTAKLATLNNLIQSTEKQRAQAYGALSGQIKDSTQATTQLHETTAQLRSALSNPQRRGQWGERMAEDVLRLAGFVEGINYTKQETVVDGKRPDFTFALPDQRRLHMDVKFPLSNYLKVLDAGDDETRATFTAQFLKDVRMRVKEVTDRTYIDTAGGTLDYVLVFIPNEQVYGFIHEHDSTILDDSLRNKVVLCSPMTLYAILAVVRQSTDQFRLEQNSKQILELLAEFKKQWGKYIDVMDAMGKRLDDAVKEYGKLVGVRTKQLDRQLDKIDDLRAAGDAQLDRTAAQPLLVDDKTRP
jgi:DNA recombination protein RmuC